jgi:peptidyl-prolyl cis-trans isomerase C
MMKCSGGVVCFGSNWLLILCLPVFLMAGFVSTPAWSAEKAAAPVQAGAGKTIVEVNGLPLTQGEVDQKVNRTIESLKDQIPPDQLEEFKKNVQGKIVDDFINRTIISQEMDKQKITADESEVQKALDEVASKVPQGMTLEAMLKQGGVTMDEMKDNIRFSLRANKLFETQVKSDYVPTAEEISTYYNENKKKYDMPESVHARHILIKVDEKADDKTKAEKKGKIEAVRKQLVGGADFAKLAGEVSDCPSKAKGGDLGTFPRGRMVKPFEDAAFGQKVNEIGPVIQTQFGYHIIQVLEHSQAKQKSLEEVKSSIEETLKNRKRQEIAQNYMEGLKQKAKIVYPAADAAKK